MATHKVERPFCSCARYGGHYGRHRSGRVRGFNNRQVRRKPSAVFNVLKPCSVLGFVRLVSKIGFVVPVLEERGCLMPAPA